MPTDLIYGGLKYRGPSPGHGIGVLNKKLLQFCELRF